MAKVYSHFDSDNKRWVKIGEKSQATTAKPSKPHPESEAVSETDGEVAKPAPRSRRT